MNRTRHELAAHLDTMAAELELITMRREIGAMIGIDR